MNIQPALDYIKENFRSELKAAEIAKKFRLDRFAFSREFNQQTGLSFDKYIQGLRLEEARRLIDGGKSLKEACFESGFQSESQFQRVFKQNICMTPKEYREAGSYDKKDIREELDALLEIYIQRIRSGYTGWGISFNSWLEINNHYVLVGMNKYKKIQKNTTEIA